MSEDLSLASSVSFDQGTEAAAEAESQVQEETTISQDSLETDETAGIEILQAQLSRQSSLLSSKMTSKIIMPYGDEIEIDSAAGEEEDIAEFVQMTSADRLALDQREQSEVRYAITRKQHPLFKKMDLNSGNLDELVGFHSNLENVERHFAKFDFLRFIMAQFKHVSPIFPGDHMKKHSRELEDI
jgi:hypothetical protein